MVPSLAMSLGGPGVGETANAQLNIAVCINICVPAYLLMEILKYESGTAYGVLND